MLKPNYGYHDILFKEREGDGITSWDQDAERVIHTQAAFKKLLAMACRGVSTRILEIGCGCGQITQVLAHFADELTALDISQRAVLQAKKQLADSKVEFICGDFLNYSQFADKQFDIIVDSHVFHCIIGGDRRLFLDKVYQLLAPGGAFILRSMCGDISLKEDDRTKVDLANGIVYILDKEGRFFPFRQVEAAEKLVTSIENAGFVIAHQEIESGLQDVLSIVAIKPPFFDKY